MSKHPQDQRSKPDLPYFSFGFSGRIGRLEFTNRFITYLLLFTAIYLLYYFVMEKGLFPLFDSNDKITEMTINLVRLIFYTGFAGSAVLLNLRMAIMRLHDINLSGWWSSVLFIFPYCTDLTIIMMPMTLSPALYHTLFYIFATIGLLARLFPFFMPGNLKTNHYGKPFPKGHPIGAILLSILVIAGIFILYRYITLQSISTLFLGNITS
ncbi:DUF805 domain-containing protein [Ignatzschineria sp. LJL83]